MAEVSQQDIQSLQQSINALAGKMGGKSSGLGGVGTTAPSADFSPFVSGVNTAGKIAGTALENVASAFNTATPGMTSFASVISGGNKTFGQLVGVMDAQVAQFRQLSGAGVDFGGSLFTLTARATEAGLPLDVFNKTITERAGSLARAFGTAEEGASQFSKISGNLMSSTTGFGKQLGNLGFSMDEIANNTASYIELQQRNGNLQKMTTEQMAQGAFEYNLELDRMSKATGINRKILQEANEAGARDIRQKNLLAALSAKDPTGVLAAQFNAEVERMKAADPSGQLAAGFVDSAATGGVAITKASQNYQLAMQKAGVDGSKVSRDIFNGVDGSLENMRKAHDKAASANIAQSEGSRRLIGVQTTLGQTSLLTAQAGFGMMSTQMSENVKTAGEVQKTLKDQAKTEPTRKLLTIDQDLVKAQNNFRIGIVETGTLMNSAASAFDTGAQAALGASKLFVDMSTVGKTTMLGIGAALTTISSILPSLGTVATGGAGMVAASAVGGAGVAAATATKVEGGAAKVAMSLGKRYLVPILAVGGAITYALWDKDEPPEVMPMPTSALGAASTAQVNAAAVDLSKLQFPDSVNTSIDAGIIKLKSLSDAVRVTTSSFSELDNVSLSKLNESLDKLNANILKLNEKPTGDKPESTPVAANSKDTNTAMLERLDQLNSTMMAMASHQSDAVDYLSKTAKNTRQSVGNMIG
jgi:hypothetical protein